MTTNESLVDRIETLEQAKDKECKQIEDAKNNGKLHYDMNLCFLKNMIMLKEITYFQDLAWVLVKQIFGHSFWKYMQYLVSA